MNSRLDIVADWVVKARSARYRAGVLAALCSVSRRHLERFFREKFAQSPEAWLAVVQLHDAGEMLLGGKSVKEAAAATGFGSGSAFCRKYRRHFGVSPLAATVGRSLEH